MNNVSTSSIKVDFNSSANNNWFSSPLTDHEYKVLDSTINDSLNEKLQKKLFSEKEIIYIDKLPLRLLKETKTANLDLKALNIIRELCKSYNVDMNILSITSHRPIIGKFIVALKKMLYPTIKIFLKDILRQQRDFNYSMILANIEAFARKG